jgi:hypothetical protein
MTDDDAGDAACWLDRVCDVCGGFIDDRREHECRSAVDRSGSAAGPPVR